MGKMGKDPKSEGKADPYIIWVDKFSKNLPEDIKLDKLATKIEMLIALVKEDHAKYQYQKELKNYAPLVVDILNFAKKNGYVVSDVERENMDDIIKDNDGKKWDDIVDG